MLFSTTLHSHVFSQVFNLISQLLGVRFSFLVWTILSLISSGNCTWCFVYYCSFVFFFGLNYGVSCFCKLVPEMPEHLFFSCPLAQSVLSWLQSLMFCSSSCCPSLSCRRVLFCFDPGELPFVPNVFVYMLNVCKYFIRHAHNDFRFRDVQPGAIIVTEKVKSRVRFHLPLLFKRFRSSCRQHYFDCQWDAWGIIGSVIGTRLVVHLLLYLSRHVRFVAMFLWGLFCV